MFKYVERKSPAAKKKPGKSYKAEVKKPKLGSGGRFSALTSALKRKGSANPKALAAWIGRKVHGKKTMAKIASSGKKKG